MTETTTDLEIVLPDGENLTPEEMLVAKTALGLKAMNGLVARLESLCINDLGKNDDNVVHKTEPYMEGLRKSYIFLDRVIQEYALQKGISQDRYEQIWDMVYSREAKM